MKKKIAENQISLFECLPSEKVSSDTLWKVYVDGASRGNPGLASCGIVIYHNDKLYKQEGFFLNHMTNNQAEYLGLIVGLLIVKQEIKPGDKVHIVSDSQLLVRQIQGIYKVKNEQLLRMYRCAVSLLSTLHYSCEHVLREYNQEADRAANNAFETKKKVPVAFVEVMKQYDIIL